MQSRISYNGHDSTCTIMIVLEEMSCLCVSSVIVTFMSQGLIASTLIYLKFSFTLKV